MSRRPHIFVAGKEMSRNARRADLEIEFHVECAGDGIVAVGRNFFEAQAAIHGDCIFHYRLDGVEAHVPVAHLACDGDEMLGDGAPQSFAAKGGAQVEALHFANARRQLVERNATGRRGIAFDQQQTTVGRSIVAGQACQFLVKVLKAQGEAEGRGILEEELAHLHNLSGRAGGSECQGFHLDIMMRATGFVRHDVCDEDEKGRPL